MYNTAGVRCGCESCHCHTLPHFATLVSGRDVAELSRWSSVTHSQAHVQFECPQLSLGQKMKTGFSGNPPSK